MTTRDSGWYVIYTKPNFEKKAAATLNNKGIEAFLPQQRQLKQYSDRKKWTDVVLFKSYVFVSKSDYESNPAQVAFCPGYLKTIHYNGKPAFVNEEDMIKIRQLCLQPNPITVSAASKEIGEEIEISEGIFKGIKGYILHKKNNKQLTVKINGLEQLLVVDYN